jgi:hypothetical protein
MRRASLSRGRGLVAPKARGGKTRGLNAPDDMAILRIELEDIEPLIWRRVAVPVSMNLEVVHSVIQAAVRWLIQSALITLIRLRLRSPQPAASGQRPAARTAGRTIGLPSGIGRQQSIISCRPFRAH